ncbi:MAG: MurR/RpiR family transcriptional regulator [Clostridia bacterium]
MNSQLVQKIRQYEKNFSKGQKLIAKYIEEHYDKVAFMTASKLGTTVGVSESTVVRFATEIGYSGYPGLQQAMQEMIRNRLTSVQRLEITSNNIPVEGLLDASIGQDIDIVKRTLENVDRNEFYKAADAIAKSEKIYILGAGSSHALATFLKHYMNLIFDNVVLLDESSEAMVLQQLMKVSDKDAVIVISFPRYSKRAVKAIQYSTSKGACTVAVTDIKDSPLAKFAKYSIFAKSDMVSFVDSLVAPLSLINALIVTVAIKRKEDLQNNLKNLEAIWDEYSVYEKIEENN